MMVSVEFSIWLAPWFFGVAAITITVVPRATPSKPNRGIFEIIFRDQKLKVP